MSYVKNFMTLRKPVASGGWFDSAVSTGKSILAAGGQVLADPALPAVVGLAAELKSLPSSGPATAPGEPGIGLRRVVTPLQLYVFHKKNAWAAPVAVGAVLGLPFLLGYMFGKSRKRAGTP